MAAPLKHRHITQGHLGRKAVVYVRQSSQRQVLRNKESQRLQYELKHRARSLGWRTVETVDDDLGLSAASGGVRRPGFERMLNAVIRGEVGIVFSREVSRLSRSNKDWCQLFEVCGLYYTLIGDEEHVYDPNSMDDQLVLGIKATLSVVELKVLQMRLLAGAEHKARRGELKRLPPPGYIWDAADRVVKDPDMRVQDCIKQVFTKFNEIRSVRQTFLWFNNNGVELPVNRYRGGKHVLEWKLPTKSFVYSLLQSPYYAGAYVWGRRTTEKEYRDGTVIKRQGAVRRPEDCRVLIKDHHEPYIGWSSYEENLAFMANNNMKLGSGEATGAAREGQGLLAGLLRCGHCGRKMHVRYWGRQGTAARYLCKGDFESGGSYCLAFGGGLVDRRVSKELLKVLSPHGVRAAMLAAEMLSARGNEAMKALEQKLKQNEYEERRAFEQYNEVDPRHRLVAEELERRWNARLAEVSSVKQQLQVLRDSRRVVTEEERGRLIELGEQFALVWDGQHCSASTKKNILRVVIQEIVVTFSAVANELSFVIHWQGGSHTSVSMPKPTPASSHKTCEDDLEIIRKMSQRYADDEVACVLNKLGRRTGKGNRWNAHRVAAARNRGSIWVNRSRRNDDGILSLGQAAKHCQISYKSIQKLVAQGLLHRSQIVPYAPWEIRKADLDSPVIRNIDNRLRKTGKLTIDQSAQLSMFEGQGVVAEQAN
jgi:DNA invertase Pin-like site-specific DNA recombinase